MPDLSTSRIRESGTGPDFGARAENGRRILRHCSVLQQKIDVAPRRCGCENRYDLSDFDIRIGELPAMNVETPVHDAAWTCRQKPARNARDRILNTATHLFCDEGFAATGVDRIVKESGAAKSTLYANFGSKEGLIEAVLDREGAAWRKWFFGRLGCVAGTPKDRLLALFDVLEDWFRDPLFYGCPFINAIAESSYASDATRDAAKRHKEPLLTWLRGVALELGRSDPDVFAREMVVLIDGAIVAAQSARDASFAASAKRLAERTISA